MPTIPDSKPYRIGRSKTGLGLFATKPIKKGAKIIRYIGPMLDCRKEEDDAVENKYLFQINKRWTIDGSVRENIARYINHSCKPNAESDVSARKRKVVIRAVKNIAPGDEINYDYGTEYFKEYLKPIGCKCDACEHKRAKQRAAARAERQAAKANGKTVKAKTGKAKTKATKTKATEAKKAKAAKTNAKTAKPATKAKRAVSGKGRPAHAA
ncbi:MAG: SET domain-containing protein [Xanthobacteraceae bacterium]|nr:SET domain-containing protein [Xanthobacteraceae bacterium]